MRLRILPLLLTASAASAGPSGEWSRFPALPNAKGVASPFAGVSNHALLVAGGANFPDKMPWEGGTKAWHDTVWVLDKPDGSWKSAGKLPRPLAYGVSVTVNGGVLCAGGSDAERHYADVFSLHWKDGSLERLDLPGKLPVPLAQAAGAVTGDGVVYVACGSTEPGEKSALNRVFTFSHTWKNSGWREIPVLPAAGRILPVSAARGDDFYLFGGAALEDRDGKPARRYLREAWRYSPDRGWKRLADPPRACVAAATPAPVSGPDIFLIAGDDGTKTGADPATHPGFPASILCYHTGTDTWSETGTTPAPRATVPCVKWRGAFVLPSGEVRPGVRSPEVWKFTPPAKQP